MFEILLNTTKYKFYKTSTNKELWLIFLSIPWWVLFMWMGSQQAAAVQQESVIACNLPIPAFALQKGKCKHMAYVYWTYSLLPFYCLCVTKAVQFSACFQTSQCNFSWNWVLDFGVLGVSLFFGFLLLFFKYALQELFSQSLKIGLYFLEKRSLGRKKERMKIVKIYSFHTNFQYLNSYCSQKRHPQGGPVSELPLWSWKGKQQLCGNSACTGVFNAIGKLSLSPALTVALTEFSFPDYRGGKDQAWVY